MFEKSYYEQLQDYIESGCKYQLSEAEQEYYNALFAVVGITRKYGKDRAISMLMHDRSVVPGLELEKCTTKRLTCSILMIPSNRQLIVT